jgi:hypothetical protein
LFLFFFLFIRSFLFSFIALPNCCSVIYRGYSCSKNFTFRVSKYLAAHSTLLQTVTAKRAWLNTKALNTCLG